MSSASLSAFNLIARTFSQRLGVFVDVQNMFYSAKLIHQSKVDYGRLLREITGSRHLVRAIAYIVQKPDINQSGFHEALSRLGYELKIKELKIRMDPDNRNGTIAKGSWEIGMTVDALMMAPRLDTVTLITGDGDYVPLVECLKALGCRTEVVSFERSTAVELIKAADQYIPIQDNWMFKEKKFEGGIASESGLASTVSGQTVFEGLPRDEDIEMEAATIKQTSSYSNLLGNNYQENKNKTEEQPSAPPSPLSPSLPPSPSSHTHNDRRSDFGILA